MATTPYITPALSRREFITVSGLTLVGALDALPVMAGPFRASDFEQLIPPDKKLAAQWVAALFARGERETYSKQRGELRHIGMPVGGLCCGTLYLGGDGRLWLWDIFNENRNGIQTRTVRFQDFGGERSVDPQNGANYVSPAEPRSPLTQGFALKVNGTTRTMDAQGWENITFRGEYPMGEVTYRDAQCPVSARLNAYSPFVPLNVDDSGLPATVCEFTLKNESDTTVEMEIGGWLENASSLFSAHPGSGGRVNTVLKADGAAILFTQFDRAAKQAVASARTDIVIDDFERETYAGWKVEGSAFGSGPILRANIPSYQGAVGGTGQRVVNSHASAPGATVEEKDRNTGKLTSPEFTIERNAISFYIGGGRNVEQVGLRLLVDGKTVRRAAGQDSNTMRQAAFDVREFVGKRAVIEIYDSGTGGWGNVGVDAIVQTDAPQSEVPQTTDTDYGTMALALLGAGVGKASLFVPAAAEGIGHPVEPAAGSAESAALFDSPAANEARKPVGEKLTGGLTRKIALAPGRSQTVTFVVAWHFVNSGLAAADAHSGNCYGKRFADAAAVAGYIAKEFPRLSKTTKLWRDTWYDSTLPYWFLDRTFVNTSILATSTAHRFQTGRFWAWEGVGCCEGTCTHVWHYAQAVGRVFPEIERHHREYVDFGTAFDAASGLVRYRGEGSGPAVDGQCGRILGVLREHQMSADDGFLRRVWPRVRRGMEWMMRHDSDGDGLLDGPQENTLDAAWYGKIAWLSSLYAAALRACEIMAGEVGDEAFAALCGKKAKQTQQAIEAQLFNGEYFIQRPEPGKENALGTYGTCHIDQCHGQSWAWQINTGRVLDRDKTVSALKALYKYNFAPDIGPFRRKHTPGRPYALAGDGGLIMATNPTESARAFGNSADWQYGYFNECMSGFEHQAASHMIAEGLLLEGFAVTRAIHDRYHASRRNPYNEIECSDHYSRAMASYGSFVTTCGFACHGPNAHLEFAPRLTPENFKAAFTAAEGWGTFAQKRTGKTLRAEVHLRYGRLRLKTLALQGDYSKLTAKVGGKSVPAAVRVENEHTVITFGPEIVLAAGQRLTVTLA